MVLIKDLNNTLIQLTALIHVNTWKNKADQFS